MNDLWCLCHAAQACSVVLASATSQHTAPTAFGRRGLRQSFEGGSGTGLAEAKIISDPICLCHPQCLDGLEDERVMAIAGSFVMA